jgi:adenylate cyclase
LVALFGEGHRRRLILPVSLVPILITSVLAVYRPSALARLDNAVYDIMLRAARPAGPGHQVAIVDVDERSLATVGQWPWRRDLVATLIERLHQMGAAVVALDIVFAEADRDSPLLASVRDSDGRNRQTPDDVLGSTLQRGGVVLGYGLTFDGGKHPPAACELHPLGVALLEMREDTTEPPYFRATGAVCNLPALARAAGASGFLNAAPDADGILRRVPLVAELDGRVYPGLAVAAVSRLTGARHFALRVSSVNDSILSIDDRMVPVDGKSNLLLRYRGQKRTFPYVSAADVLNGAADAETLRGKIAFVGTTALGTREVVATPLDTLFPGVEVQATVADNLLQQDFISRPTLGRISEVVVVLVVGCLVAFLVAAAGVTAGLLAGVAGAAAVWSGAVWLLAASGRFVSPLFPTVGIASTLAVMTLATFTFERRRADRAGRERTVARKLMVQTLLSLTAVRDAETGRHSLRTQRYARLLAERLAQNPAFRRYLTLERIDLLSSLAPLHDIGKVGVPDHILNKPGALTPEELTEMRKHPTLGREVILQAEGRVGVRDDETLAMAKDIVYTHHERWDGTGYPQGLRGADIPIAGRIMAVVDVYDAANTRSLYRSPLSHDDVVQMIVERKGVHFDPAVVDAFVDVAPLFRQVSVEISH